MEELVLNKLNFDLYIPAGRMCKILRRIKYSTDFVLQSTQVIDFVGFFVECIPQVEEGDKAPVYARVSMHTLLYSVRFL